MLILADMVGFFALAIPVVCSAVGFFRYRRIRTIDVVIALMFCLYAIPLALDYVVPSHLSALPANDFETGIRYQYSFVLLFSVIFLLLGAHTWGPNKPYLAFTRSHLVAYQPRNTLLIVYVVAWVVMLLPLPFVLIFSPEPTAYLSYGTTSTRMFSSHAWREMHRFVDMVNMLSLAGFVFIYWVSYRASRAAFSFHGVAALFAMVIPTWINGKRHFPVFILLMIVSIVLAEGRAKWSLLIAPILVALFTIGYMEMGGKGEFGVDKTAVEVVRADLARDYTLRITLSDTHWTSNDIYPHRGYAFKFLSVKFIPRQLWANKPYVPPTYFTWRAKRMSGRPNPYDLQGVLQYGFLEECLLNFGYIGLLGCLLVGRIARWYDKTVAQRRPYALLAWYLFPLSVLFAFNVIAQVGFLLVLPILLLGPVLSNPNNWGQRVVATQEGGAR